MFQPFWTDIPRSSCHPPHNDEGRGLARPDPRPRARPTVFSRLSPRRRANSCLETSSSRGTDVERLLSTKRKIRADAQMAERASRADTQRVERASRARRIREQSALDTRADAFVGQW